MVYICIIFKHENMALLSARQVLFISFGGRCSRNLIVVIIYDHQGLHFLQVP